MVDLTSGIGHMWLCRPLGGGLMVNFLGHINIIVVVGNSWKIVSALGLFQRDFKVN